MHGIRQLIREAHRRSLWQVLSVYLVASWVTLQVVEIITESAGLPDWAQPFALILLLIGLPVVLATAVVQESAPGQGNPPAPMPSSEPESGASRTSDAQEEGGAALAKANVDGRRPAPSTDGEADIPAAYGGTGDTPGVRYRLLTWRNAIAGGVAAFALLGLAVAGYFVMWSTGVGPVGSLAAQGVFAEGDAVVLADFASTSNDETLGKMVTEALRVDLAGSSIMTLVEVGRVEDALRRMGRGLGEPLDPELAREVAIRDGFKATIYGTVGPAGSGYLFVASMEAAESGQVLATFRESARNPGEVIDAIDKLSQDIREKAGESLRAIKAEAALENVTTSSLEALRKYAESQRLSDREEYDRAIAALQEAIELDPGFAMAYRKLAVALSNSGGPLAEQMEAATRAYELRDRLTERERYLAAGFYYRLVPRDTEAEIRAYESVLARYPDDQAALNNIALALVDRTRIDEAIEYLERAVNGPGASAPAFTNYPVYLAMAGRHDDAERAMETLKTRYPARDVWATWIGFGVAAFKPDPDGAIQAGRALLALPEAQEGWKGAGYAALMVGEVQRGRLEEARRLAERGFQDMMGMGRWRRAAQFVMDVSWMESILGRDGVPRDGAGVRADLDGILAKMPPEARLYDAAVISMARIGDGEGVHDYLQRWRDAELPSSRSPVFDEVGRYAEAMLRRESDPAGALEALDDLALEMDCSGCFNWERGSLAQQLERFEKARDHFSMPSGRGAEEFLAAPLIRVVGQERLGQVLEALGEEEKAARHYARFADLWAEADPEFQPRVEAARERIVALEAGSSSGPG